MALLLSRLIGLKWRCGKAFAKDLDSGPSLKGSSRFQRRFKDIYTNVPI